MANSARKGGNSGAVKITEYATPTLIDSLAIGGMLALYGAGVASPWVVPGSDIWSVLTQYFPGGPERFLWITQNVVKWLALTHAVETILFDQLRMRKHGVPRFSALWWKWEISVFIEGIGAWRRIGNVIAQKKKQQLKRK